jgi:hypothetical protein
VPGAQTRWRGSAATRKGGAANQYRATTNEMHTLTTNGRDVSAADARRLQAAGHNPPPPLKRGQHKTPRQARRPDSRESDEMSDHKHQLPARVLTALLIVAAVLVSLIGGDGQIPRAPWPRSHAASLVGAPRTTTVACRLGSDGTTELGTRCQGWPTTGTRTTAATSRTCTWARTGRIGPPSRATRPRWWAAVRSALGYHALVIGA